MTSKSEMKRLNIMNGRPVMSNMPKALEDQLNERLDEIYDMPNESGWYSSGYNDCYSAMTKASPPTRPMYILTSLVETNYVPTIPSYPFVALADYDKLMDDVKILVEALKLYETQSSSFTECKYSAREALEQFNISLNRGMHEKSK